MQRASFLYRIFFRAADLICRICLSCESHPVLYCLLPVIVIKRDSLAGEHVIAILYQRSMGNELTNARWSPKDSREGNLPA